MDRKLMQMEDPIFLPGSLHTATGTLTVPVAGQSCSIELFLSLNGGATKLATTTVINFTSTGVAQQVLLPLTIPVGLVSGSYGVYVDVYVGGTLVGAFQASENVVVMIINAPVITWS